MRAALPAAPNWSRPSALPTPSTSRPSVESQEVV